MKASCLILWALATCADAFQWAVPSRMATATTTTLTGARSATKLYSTLSIERTATRELDQFQEWAYNSAGIQTADGFCLVENLIDGNEDYSVATSAGGAAGSPILYVPSEAILSASRVAGDLQGYIEPSLQALLQMGRQYEPLVPHFYLFVKVLLEYENGTNSPYYPWLASLPRKWNTAASMDDFCLSCLPPFIKSLCQVQQNQLAAFSQALKAFDYLSPESKANKELLKFAYNVVMTRAWTTTPEQGGDGDLQIVPMADMFNHGFPANAALAYDETGACQVYLTEDVAPGTSLYLNYGEPANQPRFLAMYGFLNDAPATYCKLLISNPSPEIIDIGYDPSKLLFFAEDGGISQEVWDVVLYSRLERKPEHAQVKQAFYQAHASGDEETKAAIHQMFMRETQSALKLHVANILSEVSELRVKTNAYDSSKHPRLPLLRRHNDLVFSTFQKVRTNLDAMSM